MPALVFPPPKVASCKLNISLKDVNHMVLLGDFDGMRLRVIF